MSRLLCHFRVGAWCCVLAAAPAWAAPADRTVLPVPLPLGVADPAGKVGYVMGVSGHVEALDLGTGKVLWEAKEAGRPLLVVDKALLIQAPVAGKANAVRVVLLDTAREGKQLLESEPVVFPDWVSVGLTHGRTFSSEAWAHKGDLLLRWRANAFYAGGAAPTPEIQRQARKEASGVAQVNLETGKVALLPADRAPAEPGVNLPDELKKVASQQYWTGKDWKTTPFVLGNTVSALALERKGNLGKLSLRRWELSTGKPLGTVALLEGKELWPQMSADGHYLFVHQALVKEQLPPGDYAWWIFSLETGQQVAKLPFTEQLTGLTVLGPYAFYLASGPRKGPPRPGDLVQPRTLKALELKAGKLAWEHPVEGQRMLLPLP
jgi:hypothetical protein